MVECNKCEKYHQQLNKELPCANYEKGDEFLFYDDSQHDLCYQIKMPELNQSGNEAFNLWEILSDDRATGFGPSTIRTESIIFLCLALEETWEMFLMIKAIERVYFQKMVEEHSNSQGGQEIGSPNEVKKTPRKSKARRR